MSERLTLWGSIPRVFDRACSYFSNRLAIVDGERSLTYHEMESLSNRVANGLLALGLRKGERVGVLLPNSLEFLPTQVGVWKAGGVFVQMTTRASADDHLMYLRHSGAALMVYDESFDVEVANYRQDLSNLRSVIRVGKSENKVDDGILDYEEVFGGQSADHPPVMLSPDDPAYVAFTSGTTGVPKGVLQSHESWSHYTITSGLEIADSRPSEVFVHGAPLTHFTQMFVMPTFIRGGTNVLLRSLDVDGLFDTFAKMPVTSAAVVPTVIYLMLDHPRLKETDISSLRTLIYAGSPMDPNRLREAIDFFGPIFVQTYAGTEPGFLTCMRKEDHRFDSPTWSSRLASAGRPMFHVDVSIRDDDDKPLGTEEVGEICTRQIGQMIGYLEQDPDDGTVRDSWVHTGDVGYLDEEGFLFIVDRKKDMIITGGFNVFPRQVEDILNAHPAVSQSCVFGVPDDKWGEAVKACVVLRPGASVDTEDLIAFVKQRKGSVWAPKSVDVVGELPLNPNGKPDKKSLRKLYWSEKARQVG